MIEGYAAVFYDGSERSQFQLGPRMVERIMPEAFDEALRRDDVVALLNHNPDNLLGRTSAGTLTLSVDKKGLRYAIPAAETSIYKDVAELQKRGDLKGSSFAFLIDEEKLSREDGWDVREIHAVRLMDVGPVTYPAYEATNTRSDALVRFVSASGEAIQPTGHQAAEARSSFIRASDSEKVRKALLKCQIDKVRYL